MSLPRPPENVFTIHEPVACSQCGELMPEGATAWIPGWGRIEHWYSANGCDAYEEEAHDWTDGTREEAEAYTRRFGGFIARRNRTPWEETP